MRDSIRNLKIAGSLTDFKTTFVCPSQTISFTMASTAIFLLPMTFCSTTCPNTESVSLSLSAKIVMELSSLSAYSLLMISLLSPIYA